MRLDKDVGVPMRDGTVLRANVFFPDAPGRYPVLMTFGPYGKDVHLSEFMPEAWEALQRRHPEILGASSCRYLVFETPDPEMWTPHGYVVVKVDSRGAGRSPGRLAPNSPEEFSDFHEAIVWAGRQPWSSGKVGLLGISYYAAGQWMVAAMRPPHLAAILPWQGACDFYRDRTRQGGIYASGFVGRWWPRSVLRNQHGNAASPYHDIDTGERTTGPAALSAAELTHNRTDYPADILAHPLDDEWYRARTPDLSRIELPALVVANWGGLGLHLRGTIEGFLGIASPKKWLKVQSGSYFLTFLLPGSVAVQRRFFDRYLKDVDNGWESEPPVEVVVRSPSDGVARVVRDTGWPLSGVEWQRLYVDAAARTLDAEPPQRAGSLVYDASGEGVSLRTAPLSRAIELAGPVKARLWVSSSTEDMDLFLTLRAWDHAGNEAVFFSAVEPRAPLSQGWLRVSQRKLDPRRSVEHRPFHAHDERQPLSPGEIYAVDVEIWPMSIAMGASSVLELVVAGRDFQRPGAPGTARGSGFFLHEDPADRPPERFGGTCSVHSGPGRESFLLLPALSIAT